MRHRVMIAVTELDDFVIRPLKMREQFVLGVGDNDIRFFHGSGLFCVTDGSQDLSNRSRERTVIFEVN
jgi:hypothetical protein